MSRRGSWWSWSRWRVPTGQSCAARKLSAFACRAESRALAFVLPAALWTSPIDRAWQEAAERPSERASLRLGHEEDDLLVLDLAGLVDRIKAGAVEVKLALTRKFCPDCDKDHRCLIVTNRELDLGTPLHHRVGEGMLTAHVFVHAGGVHRTHDRLGCAHLDSDIVGEQLLRGCPIVVAPCVDMGLGDVEGRRFGLHSS